MTRCIWYACPRASHRGQPSGVSLVLQRQRGTDPVWFCDEHWAAYCALSAAERIALRRAWGERTP